MKFDKITVSGNEVYILDDNAPDPLRETYIRNAEVYITKYGLVIDGIRGPIVREKCIMTCGDAIFDAYGPHWIREESSEPVFMIIKNYQLVCCNKKIDLKQLINVSD